MNRRRTRRPLGWTVVAGVLLGELLFALALGLTMATFSLINTAGDQAQARERVASTVAATLMPIIADQQESRIDSTLQSIVDGADLHDIECVRIVDSSGATVASHGDVSACTPGESPQSDGVWAAFTQSQLVQRPVVIDGLEVATAYVVFSPIPLAGALRTPVIASVLVLVSIMFISVPWTAWLVVRDLTQPLQQLEVYASSIADGSYEVLPETDAQGEIGALQDTFARMADQIERQRSELQSSYDELAQAYSSLETAKRQVEELAEAKEDFVAVAAHEIRTPLSTISLYAELLEAGKISELSDEGAEAVAAIHAAASRLGAITSDLMDAALLERGLMPLQFGDVWLDDLVNEAVRGARPAANVRNQSIHVDSDLSESIVRGDPLRLHQVLDNLLSNAIKYSPEGTAIEISAREGAGEATIAVADQGRGIPEVDRTRLFRLFGRLDFGDSREVAGLGLGLAISARIVEAHGGTLSCSASESGTGSVFTMTLPEEGPPREPEAYARLGDDRQMEET